MKYYTGSDVSVACRHHTDVTRSKVTPKLLHQAGRPDSVSSIDTCGIDDRTDDLATETRTQSSVKLMVFT